MNASFARLFFPSTLTWNTCGAEAALDPPARAATTTTPAPTASRHRTTNDHQRNTTLIETLPADSTGGRSFPQRRTDFKSRRQAQAGRFGVGDWTNGQSSRIED